MKSNHTKPEKLGDGSWFCSVCGAESMDHELFEVLAAENDCVRKGVNSGAVDVEDHIPWDSVNSAREAIEQMRSKQGLN